MLISFEIIVVLVICNSSDKNYNQNCHTALPGFIDKTEIVGNCYRLLLDGNTSIWEKAHRRCEELGAELLTIENEVEQEVVAQILAEVNPEWYFFTDFTRAAGRETGLGGNLVAEYLFESSTGESLHEVGYAPWDDNVSEPSAGFWFPTCIVVKAATGRYFIRFLNEYENRPSYPFCKLRIPKRPPF